MKSPATIIVSNGVCIMSQQNIQNARMGKSKFCGHQDAVDGKEKCSIGKARPSHNGQPGQLQVAFFLSFYSDYNILELDPDYQWSLIGSSTDKYLWILSRTPHLDQNTLNQILEKARQRGYDTSRLIFPQQPES